MIVTLFRDCVTRRVVFGAFKIVDDDFCDWNRLAVYMGTIRRSGAVYNMYDYCGQIYARYTA